MLSICLLCIASLLLSKYGLLDHSGNCLSFGQFLLLRFGLINCNCGSLLRPRKGKILHLLCLA
jgi:hypothetical protein